MTGCAATLRMRHATPRKGLARRGALLCAAGLLGLGAPAHAESLADAIALAYQSNPSLQSQRARLRALDESYVQARASYRPTLSVTAGADSTRTQQTIGGVSIEPTTQAGTLSVSATQLLFDSGLTASTISAAKADILAGRERLRAAEGSILLSVVQAYAAVRRDQQQVAIQAQTVKDYERQAEEIRARAALSDVTRTDEGQVEAQLGLARATYAASQGQLDDSRAAYAALVGQYPGELEPEPPLAGLPATEAEAVEAAERDSPTILASMLDQRAATERVTQAKARFGPSIGVRASVGFEGPVDPIVRDRYDREVVGAITITQPLATGGLNRSLVRAARENAAAQRADIDVARRSVRETIAQSWNQISAARRQQEYAAAAVRAAEVAAEGSSLEYSAGLRTTLEVLVERQRLRDAQALVVQSRYSEYVGQARMLNAVGRIDEATLTAATPTYDPAKNFDRVRNRGGFITDPVVEGLNQAVRPREGGAVAMPVATAPQPAPALPPAVPAPSSQVEPAQADPIAALLEAPAAESTPATPAAARVAAAPSLRADGQDDIGALLSGISP